MHTFCLVYCQCNLESGWLKCGQRTWGSVWRNQQACSSAACLTWSGSFLCQLAQYREPKTHTQNMFNLESNDAFSRLSTKVFVDRCVKFNNNQSTHRFFIGQKHIHEEGHSHCVSSGNDDVSIICLWGDHNTLCRFHPADPLDLQYKQNNDWVKNKNASDGLGCIKNLYDKASFTFLSSSSSSSSKLLIPASSSL